MQPRSLPANASASESRQPGVNSAEMKQLKLKHYLASQTDSRAIAHVPAASTPSASPRPVAQLQSLKPVLASVLRALVSENASLSAWSKAALQFDTASGKATSLSTLDKFNEESANMLDLGARLAVSSSNERRLQSQLAASIAEIAELRSNSRQSNDLSLARENQDLRNQLAAAQRARSHNSPSASQLELLQSKCSSLESENEVMEAKCRRLQQEIQRLNEKSPPLPATFWEEQRSVLSEIYDLKKEYEDLLAAHMNGRAEIKALVEEKNALAAQLANKEHECSSLSADLKSCKSKISRLESEMRSRSGDFLNGSDSAAAPSVPVAGSPQCEAFVPTNRSAGNLPTAAAWLSVSPKASASRSAALSQTFSTSPADSRASDRLDSAAKASHIASQKFSSHEPMRFSPSHVADASEELRGSAQDIEPYSQKMKAVLDLVSTLDSRLLSLDAMSVSSVSNFCCVNLFAT
jgi:hypothetical protein